MFIGFNTCLFLISFGEALEDTQTYGASVPAKLNTSRPT